MVQVRCVSGPKDSFAGVKYPRIGEVVEEFRDNAKKSPGTYEEFGDSKKEAIVRAEDHIDLFLNMHAFDVDTDQGQTHIKGVTVFRHTYQSGSSIHGQAVL